MDLNNVKIDWEPILEGQIKHLESLYPDIAVRKSFQPVIEALNSNKIKSRVVLSGINVSAYAFITPSSDLNDRIYASMGFTDPVFATEDRIVKLLTWLEENARVQKKYVMLNDIFNAEETAEKVMLSRGYRKFVRNRLFLELSKYTPQEIIAPEGLEEAALQKLDAQGYSDSEFDAFSGTADQILFNSEDSMDRVQFSKGLLEGKLGPVIEPASRFLVKGGRIVAASVCTHYRSVNGVRTALLADIFVVKDYQGKGLAKYLLSHSLDTLKKMNYEECALWVSSENPARKIYDRLGFADSGTTEVFYYRKP